MEVTLDTKHFSQLENRKQYILLDLNHDSNYTTWMIYGIPECSTPCWIDVLRYVNNWHIT